MVETQNSGATAWRLVRIVALSLLSLFLLGVVGGFTVGHLEDGSVFDLRLIAVVGPVLLCIAACVWLIRRDVKVYVAEEWTVPSDAGEGERLYAEQRKRFWTLLGALALLGAVIGFVSAMMMTSEAGSELTPAWTIAAVVLIAAFVALAGYGSWRFFQSVDELEMADNLWGSLIGFYAYALLFPAWWAMSVLDAVPEPDAWVIYGTSMTVAVLTYFYRKWRLR